MMNMKTLRAIESLKAEMGGRLFQKREIHGVSYSTLKKYGYIESVREEECFELSMEEAVEILNEMAYAGYADYYTCDNYTKFVIRDGKVWKIVDFCGYKFVE